MLRPPPPRARGLPLRERGAKSRSRRHEAARHQGPVAARRARWTLRKRPGGTRSPGVGAPFHPCLPNPTATPPSSTPARQRTLSMGGGAHAFEGGGRGSADCVLRLPPSTPVPRTCRGFDARGRDAAGGVPEESGESRVLEGECRGGVHGRLRRRLVAKATPSVLARSRSSRARRTPHQQQDSQLSSRRSAELPNRTTWQPWNFSAAATSGSQLFAWRAPQRANGSTDLGSKLRDALLPRE